MRNMGGNNDAWPAIIDLKKRAKKRIPFFAWEYLDSGTGREEAVSRNEAAFSHVMLTPEFFKGSLKPDTSTSLFGKQYSVPFGIAPIGMSSLMWPGAEQILARTAGENALPYCLSTVAAESPEATGPLARGNGWFQLYPPRQEHIRKDLLKRAKDSGFSALVVTADVPVPSMRERQRRAGMTMPPKTTFTTLRRVLARPHWARATLSRGKPRFLGLEKYADASEMAQVAQFVGRELGGTLDWDHVKTVRDEWDGPLIVKGIMSTHDCDEAIAAGCDGIWVSNHGGRQLDAAPPAIEVLPELSDHVGGRAKVLFDSGVRSGLDVARALASGADFVFCGRAFMYGVCALGEGGGQVAHDILKEDLENNMIQLGTAALGELPLRLHRD